MIRATFNHIHPSIELYDGNATPLKIYAGDVGSLIEQLTLLRVHFPVLPRPAMLEDDFATLQDEERYDDQSWGH